VMGIAHPLRLAIQMSFCSSGKRGYASFEEVARQLRSARWRRTNDPDQCGRAGRRERIVYACKGCSWYHLSSAAHRSRRGVYAYRHRHSGLKRSQ
jgi:hypothetical protein